MKILFERKFTIHFVIFMSVMYNQSFKLESLNLTPTVSCFNVPLFSYQSHVCSLDIFIPFYIHNLPA